MIVAALAALSVVRTGEAQAPIPSTDVQTPTGTVADRAAALGDAHGPSLGWTLGMDVGGGYDSNVLLALPGDPGDESSRLHADAGLDLRAPRGTLALTLDGSGLLYRQEHGLNQFTYQLGATGTYDLAPRVTARIAAAERTSLSTDVAAIGPGLPLLPLALSHTTAGSIGLDDRMSPRTTATLDASYTDVTFGTVGLTNGETGTARLAVMHAIARDASIGMSYTGQVISTSVVQWLPAAEAIGATDLGPLKLQLHAGAATLMGPGTVNKVDPIGGADLQYPVGRGGVELLYGRTVNEVFGLGAVYITDAIGLAYTHPAFFGCSIRAGVDQSWGTFDGPQGQRLEATGASLQVRRQLASGAWVGVGGFLRRRIQTILVADQGVLVSAGYTVTR